MFKNFNFYIKTENHKQKDAGYQPASFHIQTIYAMINKYILHHSKAKTTFDHCR